MLGGGVCSASYEAKAFGVMAACRDARRGSFVRSSSSSAATSRSTSASATRRSLCSAIQPLVERISIDEAFADVAGCTHLFGPPEEIAGRIRERVRTELGLPISVGVARTKHLAKIASQVAKPDGLLRVEPGTELEFLHGLPVELMWGVGPVTRAKLAEAGVTTIGQLANTPGWSLEHLLGTSAGAKLRALAWDRDPREIRTRHRSQSAGAQSALGLKPAVERIFRPTLLHLADRICSRLRAKARPGRTVTVRVRFADLRAVTRSATLDQPVSATAILAEDSPRSWCAQPLPTIRTRRRYRCSPFRYRIWRNMPRCSWSCRSVSPTKGGCRAAENGMARWKADSAVDSIRGRFGWEAVGYASVALDARRSVPDAFRELADEGALVLVLG